jgi:hypothetical protein
MGLLNLSTGNLEFETQPGDPVYIFGSGILDKDGNEIRGHPLLNKLVVIQNGKVVCSVIGGANIAIQEPIQPGDWSMIFQAESTMNYDPSTDAMISFSPSLNLLSSQIGKSQPIYFDGKTSDANPITYTNKGTLVESIGSAGNIQGLYFGMHTNYKQPELMPVFWDWHEPYFEYHEGKGLSSWSYLPSLSFIENVYPNPVERDGVLNIKVKMATPGRVHFEIYDIQGRAVIGGDTDYTGRQNRGEDKGTLLTSSEKILEIPIKPLGLSSGAYILRLHPDNSSEFFDAYAKFIVK